MKLEPLNIVCPKCGNPNYMRLLVGKDVGKLDVKCINCNSYFNFDELYKWKISNTLTEDGRISVDEAIDILFRMSQNHFYGHRETEAMRMGAEALKKIREDECEICPYKVLDEVGE